MTVNIFLRQFGRLHLSSACVEVVNWLRNGESSEQLLSAERLRRLLEILPDDDDVQLLDPYKHCQHRLGIAERFYLELMSVPQ